MQPSYHDWYPPKILKRKNSFCIVQISDLHLTGKIAQDDSYQKFAQVLKDSLKERPDLLLLTGDICNDGNTKAYNWVFGQLSNTQIPFACIAGNHDVTHEINTHLPYEQRLHLPLTADKRLLNQHQIFIHVDECTYQIILLDSTVAGETFGRLSQHTLNWLDNTLNHYPLPSIIALHHHPIPMDSAWLDHYILQNNQELWRIINQYPHARWLLCGHVHQAHELIAPTKHLCRLFTCPSTDRQFLPKKDDFHLDNISSGYRVIKFDNAFNATTYIKRL